jgi:hypothetical protein
MRARLWGKQALWRQALNQLHWMVTEPRVLLIRLACLNAYLRLQWADTRHFEFISEADFQSSRKSQRVFIFGSGGSLNEVSPDEWAHIAQHDTFGFSMFVYQEWVRTDYHMLREMYVLRELERDFWYPYSQEFAHYFDTNPHFEKTILLAQAGWRSLTVNRMMALGMLTRPRRVLSFKVVNSDGHTPPNFSLEQGIVHGAGSLTDAINLAVIAGWQHIILAGVDLYNAQYFWEDRHANSSDFGRDPNQIHNTVTNGILNNIAQWRDILAGRGVQLWVYNPKSLLTQVLPIYTPEAFEAWSNTHS